MKVISYMMLCAVSFFIITVACLAKESGRKNIRGTLTVNGDPVVTNAQFVAGTNQVFQDAEALIILSTNGLASVAFVESTSNSVLAKVAVDFVEDSPSNVDAANNILFNLTTSVFWSARQLFDDEALLTVDWDEGLLLEKGFGVETVDWFGTELIAGSTRWTIPDILIGDFSGRDIHTWDAMTNHVAVTGVALTNGLVTESITNGVADSGGGGGGSGVGIGVLTNFVDVRLSGGDLGFPTATTIQVPWSNVVVDADNMYVQASNHIKIIRTGRYMSIVNMSFNSVVGASVEIYLYKNNGLVGLHNEVHNAGSGKFVGPSYTEVQHYASNSVASIRVFHDSGVTEQIESNTNRTRWILYFLKED